MNRPILSTWLRAAASVLLLALVLPCQDEGKAVSGFKKLFRVKKNQELAVAQATAGIETLDGFDSPDVAEVLADAWLVVEAQLADGNRLREELNQEMRELVEGQETARSRRLPRNALDRLNEIKRLVALQRTRCDELRELQDRLSIRLADLRRRDSLLWLIAKVLPGRKHPLPLRLAAGRAVGGGAVDVLPEIATALTRSRQPEEQIALIDAMGLAGKMARLHATPVIDLLSSKHEAVRERAALALAHIAVSEAVEPMLKLVETSTGQTRLRIIAALEVLTGKDFGTNTGAWRAWWQSEGAAVAAGQTELGQGTPSHRKETNARYYFGIPQDESKSILYVIDCSGSMTAPISLPGGTAAGGKGKETTRLEGCKRELIKALGLLKPEQKFAILYYNDLPHWWEPKLQKADKDVVETAQKFVATLQPSQTTNIHDSLEQGFTLVGRGVKDKYYGVELDTIFLLTDGSPTTPDGKPDSTEKIIQAVRAWNPLKRVTIHTIGIGGNLNAPFLRQLASENGGQFKAFI